MSFPGGRQGEASTGWGVPRSRRGVHSVIVYCSPPRVCSVTMWAHWAMDMSWRVVFLGAVVEGRRGLPLVVSFSTSWSDMEIWCMFPLSTSDVFFPFNYLPACTLPNVLFFLVLVLYARFNEGGASTCCLDLVKYLQPARRITTSQLSDCLHVTKVLCSPQPEMPHLRPLFPLGIHFLWAPHGLN